MNTGATSLTSVTVMANTTSVSFNPSLARTVKSYTLSAPVSPGVSKSGEVLKVNTPAADIVNKAASTPNKLYVTPSFTPPSPSLAS